jgi:hypothetical protein
VQALPNWPVSNSNDKSALASVAKKIRVGDHRCAISRWSGSCFDEDDLVIGTVLGNLPAH